MAWRGWGSGGNPPHTEAAEGWEHKEAGPQGPSWATSSHLSRVAPHLHCHGGCGSQVCPGPRGEWAHLFPGQWSGRGAHGQCGLAQEFGWGRGSTMSWAHGQAPLSPRLPTPPRVLLPASNSPSPQWLPLSTLRTSSRLWGPRSLQPGEAGQGAGG